MHDQVETPPVTALMRDLGQEKERLVLVFEMVPDPEPDQSRVYGSVYNYWEIEKVVDVLENQSGLLSQFLVGLGVHDCRWTLHVALLMKSPLVRIAD